MAFCYGILNKHITNYKSLSSDPLAYTGKRDILFRQRIGQKREHRQWYSGALTEYNFEIDMHFFYRRTINFSVYPYETEIIKVLLKIKI